MVADFEITVEDPLFTPKIWRKMALAALETDNEEALGDLGFQGFYPSLSEYLMMRIEDELPAHMRWLRECLDWWKVKRQFLKRDKNGAKRDILQITWPDPDRQDTHCVAIFEYVWKPDTTSTSQPKS